MKLISINCVLLLCLWSQVLQGQSSTFDADNEGWRTTGDPSTEIPGWVSMGGNPGGYIRGTDAAVGGIWYFRAPLKFTGNKCEAYGRYLRWDQTINGVPNQQPGGSPDLLLFGAGLTLAYDNPVTPGTTWTHYDVLLREDAGWRLNDYNGPIPTQAQFQAVLANLTGLQIRGEYITGDDNGCLDNFILENDFQYALDSARINGDFFYDTLCTTEAPLCGNAALLVTAKRVDSIVVQLLFPQSGGTESFFLAGPLPAGIESAFSSPITLTLFNLGPASPADFIQALQQLRYQDGGPAPPRGTRIATIRVFTACGDMGARFAYLPIFPPVDAGGDAQIELCHNQATPVNLSEWLSGDQPDDAYWRPALPTPGLFDARRDPPGAYAYIIPSVAACPGDTALVAVSVRPNIQIGGDTTLCKGDTLLLDVPENLAQWRWNTGSRARILPVTLPGMYDLEGSDDLCTYADSVQITFFQCTPCDLYAPNAFSPNDDGWNDEWLLFLPCDYLEFHLEVFDRWGNLVFAADQPDAAWDGRYQGRPLLPGVYVWRLNWSGELLGDKKEYAETGEVVLVK
ncbi:MAG: laminin B domain-containing protein [Saprospiraceae bacterium]